MLTHLRPALVMLAVFTALTGIIYPLSLTGLLQVIAPSQANGSLITRKGAVVGSALIGQTFTSDGYFRGRPSAAGDKGYDAASSSGSNLGPLSKKLLDRVEGAVADMRKAGTTVIPADAVTTSASGLDPHISPDYATAQVPRVATARKIDEGRVYAILQQHMERPLLGIFGEPRVNVLELNLALDAALAAGAG
jgi:potassium-transporting ATPase KdpC subunit